MHDMKNAVIILNYNDADTTIKLINAIREYKSIDKLIVVDNLSKDDSFSRLKELEGGKVDVIRAKSNAGYAAGNNFGAFYAIEKYSPEFITIANPDVFFEDGTMADMLEALKTQSAYALCGVMVNQRYNVWNMLKYWGMIESLLLVWLNIHRRTIRKRLERGAHIEEVGVISGSFFAMKADVFSEIDGMDENTFLFEEENILAYRLGAKGYKEIVLTDRFYDHLHSQSIKKSYPSKAKAFKLFYPSLKYFNKEYLKTGAVKNVFFNICYAIGYAERVVYDIVFRIIK